MEFEDLPHDVSVFLRGLKHGSGTLQLDILDAFEKAETLDEAITTAIDSTAEIMGEAANNIVWLNSYQKNKEI